MSTALLMVRSGLTSFVMPARMARAAGRRLRKRARSFFAHKRQHMLVWRLPDKMF